MLLVKRNDYLKTPSGRSALARSAGRKDGLAAARQSSVKQRSYSPAQHDHPLYFRSNSPAQSYESGRFEQHKRDANRRIVGRFTYVVISKKNNLKAYGDALLAFVQNDGSKDAYNGVYNVKISFSENSA